MTIARLKLIFVAIAVSLGAAIVNAMPSVAAPPPQVFRDHASRIYFHGLLPHSRIELITPEQTEQRRYRVGFCGLVRIPLAQIDNPPRSIWLPRDNQGFSTQSLPEQTLPRCVNNTLSESRLTHFRTATHLVLVGFEPGTYIDVDFGSSYDRVYRYQVNACGFVRLPDSINYLTWSGVYYAVNRLPVAVPPLCRDGVLYTPQSWE